MADVSASAIVALHGMTTRHWTRLAAAGKIPGAWQPSGERGKWLFDPIRFAEWRASFEREEAPWRVSTVEARPGGRVGNVAGPKDGRALRQRIDELLRSVSGNGSTGSTPSHGVWFKAPDAEIKKAVKIATLEAIKVQRRDFMLTIATDAAVKIAIREGGGEREVRKAALAAHRAAKQKIARLDQRVFPPRIASGIGVFRQ